MPHLLRFNCGHLVGDIPILDIVENYSKDKPPLCTDCDTQGPNVWICLYQDCYYVGCGERFNDHSSAHNKENPHHCIHMNLLTRRFWCYKCSYEVYTLSATDEEPASVRERAGDSEEDDEQNSDEVDESSGGLVGLQNLGNTCYMNAALQALSNAPPLTRFFLECSTTVQMLSEGKKPGLSRTYCALLGNMWQRHKNGRQSRITTPQGILYGMRSVHPMFRGYYQHDTQEFLRNFMDQLHEELKQVSIFPDDDRLTTAKDIVSGDVVSTDGQAVPDDESTTSEGEYETCDSGVSERSSLSGGSDSESKDNHNANSKRRRKSLRLIANPDLAKNNHKFRSIISDVFDGKLLSSVQCLTCDRVSSRVETFQDLSLPIPSRDHLVVLHKSSDLTSNSLINAGLSNLSESWMTWLLSWFKSWFYGPLITLHDCLQAFFSTDELKGDNMYSCERCNKLRNGVKYSKVLQLPEILCIHLKRFRHELMFSSKISSVVTFPLDGLDMRPYLHTECTSNVTRYELFSVICHYGTAGGGHYVAYALNGGRWYEFDDQYVTAVSAEKVQSCEAYVLFYRKKQTSETMAVRKRASELYKQGGGGDDRVFVSKQWLTRFETCAEPGPIDNSDFLCRHGYLSPDVMSSELLGRLAVGVPRDVYLYLHGLFGGCAPLTGSDSSDVCQSCLALGKRLLNEMETFVRITRSAHAPLTHLISTAWYTQWHKWAMERRGAAPPGPIDNSRLADEENPILVNEEMWRFFHDVYGGGPEVVSSSSCGSSKVEDVIITQVTGDNNDDSSDKGEPMEVVEDESTTGGGDTVGNNNINNSVSDGEVGNNDLVENHVRNSKRHRRRRKAVSGS